MNKQIEEMAKDIWDALPDYEHNFRDCRDAAERMLTIGYRKQEQGECEYCKTGEEKCQTCTEFYKNTDDRCSGYDDGKCIKYTPVKYCFNCGAKMKGE